MAMKLLWVCNMLPGDIREKVTGKTGSVFWVDHVLSDIRQKQIPLRILCRGGNARGELDNFCSYALFPQLPPQEYSSSQEEQFLQELKDYQPDVIHIWGSEYGHTWQWSMRQRKRECSTEQLSASRDSATFMNGTIAKVYRKGLLPDTPSGTLCEGITS